MNVMEEKIEVVEREFVYSFGVKNWVLCSCGERESFYRVFEMLECVCVSCGTHQDYQG